MDALTFLHVAKSSKAEEFRTACDSKFSLSTVFRTPDEIVELRKDAIAVLPEPLATNGVDETDIPLTN